MAAVRLALVLEVRRGHGALALAQACRAAGLEASVLLDAETAADAGPWRELARTLDVGVRLPALAGGFAAAATPAYEAVLFAAGRVPSCVAPDGPLPPDAYRTLAEWNVRAVVAEHGPGVPHRVPYFLAGRLHLTNQVAGADLPNLAAAAAARVAALAPTGGVAALRIATDAGGDPDGFLNALAETGAEIGSVRTAWNALQDIPYDHAVPLAALQEIAAQAATGTLAPFRYALGFWAPAEQLALLANFWAVALEKGKPGRNATARCPLPGASGTTTATELSAEAVAAVVKDLNAAIRDRGELPGALAGVAVEDLLPTLAAGFAAPLPPLALPVVRGVWRSPATAREHRWTFKPAIDFFPA